ncbi:V-type ATP synthase subunit D [Candidatus Micrarchaeota archaeon CG08_land_8_20_14_0_20_49_17]|nr:MAG: hypothetical protein AUJ13_04355 [Candidatus Micrarchaeota archaeon CG1_02_49_24]PIU10232.1 MAG: V-type ATP synthase subunit D [Candidatus Micrarchaeota archaeon CG08_land_8_20_14_0_20_49_17]PIZ96986.1 MAG: V-type ATP synthase subunit D [Candidatus Micrarchaeota archaeon CG_4_10_14_0_2_um_filter_49_7]HII54146.1 V-type ATP synthase subunit D [Candidatus Micrarchaeota archaeon]
MDINPTRMELIKLKARIKLAVNGHGLLKRKRDALILEFFALLKKVRDIRKQVDEQMERSYEAIARAQIYHNSSELENIARAARTVPNVVMDIRNIMGVKIPSIRTAELGEDIGSMDSILIGGSAKIDEAISSFRHSLELIVRLAESETAVRRLIREIEKTKRRVNALEFNLIPQLRGQAKWIGFRLDEMERDSFFMLKMIKKKIARRKAVQKGENGKEGS